jgi:hypothetical protein
MAVDIQWTDEDPETGEKRFVCAEKFARGWRFKTRFRRREDWAQDVVPSKAMLDELLDAVQRRYQRREGIDDRDLAVVRKMVADWKETPSAN